MSEDTQDATNGTVQEAQDDTPKFHLYVRASLIDNETQGACPMSQQGFMLSYLLAQEKNVDFKVWTVSQVNPPADFKEKNISKIYPFVEGISGRDINGQSIAGFMPDTTDKTDDFFDSVNFDCPNLKRPREIKGNIMERINSTSTIFNKFLKGLVPKETVTNLMKKVNDHLEANGTTFLEGEHLSYTDCFFLPKLQHIIIAGKHFKDYEISPTMTHLWRYLKDAYETPAFSETLPTDEDLCKFHWERFSNELKRDYEKNKVTGAKFGVKNPNKKTCSVPDEIMDVLNRQAANGDGQEEEDDGVEDIVQQVEQIQANDD